MLFSAIAILHSHQVYGNCNAGTWSSALNKNVEGSYDWVFPEGETRELPMKSLNETFTLKCQNGQVVLQCGSLKDALPECGGDANKEITLGSGNSVKSKIVEGAKKLKESRQSESNQGANLQSTTNQQESVQTPTKTASVESAQATTDAGKILDNKTQSGDKTDLSNQSVDNKSGGSGATAPTGSTVSGNVEKSSFVGASSLDNDYGMGNCGSGNIFEQLACRAGVIGSGLKTVGYMIAGFGLIVFSFAAIFGKVKWPLFATIMFSCFLLSATIFVINMMTKSGDASWIGGIKSNGSNYTADVGSVPATDSGGVPDGESPT